MNAPEVRCPAGEQIAESAVSQGPACRCRIAHETVDLRTNERSYVGFCAGNYGACPTWRADVDRGRELARELAEEGSAETSRPPLLVSRTGG